MVRRAGHPTDIRVRPPGTPRGQRRPKNDDSPQYQHAYAHDRVRLQGADGRHVNELFQVEYGRQSSWGKRREKTTG